jgi:hypothetical protein
MEVGQHRKLGIHRQAPRWGEKDDDVPARYLGTNQKRTRGATASSKTMDKLQMKKSTWMELCKIFQLDPDNPCFAQLLDTVLNEWQWNSSFFKDLATLSRRTSIPLTSILRMSNGFTTSNTQDGSHPSETAPDQSTIPCKPPSLRFGVMSPSMPIWTPHDMCPHKGVWNYYLTTTLLNA